jgi:tetratricopeptide (TPR) repeat protein
MHLEVRRGERANLEKAIDIKRRAQRCIQNGDLDGALNEYEKLVDSEESDPYNYVLLADLLYKKGDQGAASERYLSAVGAYERASLFKNAIAVCKKMLRLSLSPARVLQSLGNLHALDGLSGEAALYYVQYAEHMVRSSAPVDAANALRQAFDVCQDNVRVLEQLSEAWLLAGENGKAGAVLLEAAAHYRSRGAEADARRCTDRSAHIDPNPGAESAAAPTDDLTPFAMASVPTPALESGPRSTEMADPRAVDLSADGGDAQVHGEAISPAPPLELERMDGLESGRHDAPRPTEAEAPAEPVTAAFEPPATPDDDEVHAQYDADRELADDEVVVLEQDDDEEDAGVDYVIEDETPSMASDPVEDDVLPEAPEDEPVYEITEDEVIPFEAVVSDVASEEPVHATADDSPASSSGTPEAPGLAAQPSARMEDPEPSPEEIALAEVEMLLASAQEQFRAGERDDASHTLMRAAQAYESLERLENAATIYRSLGKGAHATPEILELWLGNCERRQDTHEAAAVACDLGDRALNDGDEDGARGSVERAMALDGNSEPARRRLERLAQATARASAAVAVATAETAPEEAAAPPAQPAQRVEIAVGRAEAVSFDLAGLLAEFQRGVEAQLAGDAQSHYDLAMTYREMGLLDQAMESFRHAEQDTRFAARAAEMAARCLADQGRHGEAALEFGRALAMPGVTDQNDIELRYYFGNSLVELGRLAEAMTEYELVMERMPEFEDVSDRLDALRRTLDAA